MTRLQRRPGIQVQSRVRHPQSPRKCTACHQPIEFCPRTECGARLAGTAEKGVDTAIATDMIRLAWEAAYEVAVLTSSNANLVPAVEFLSLKKRRVLPAGFSPSGTSQATPCWASSDFCAHSNLFRKQQHESGTLPASEERCYNVCY